MCAPSVIAAARGAVSRRGFVAALAGAAAGVACGQSAGASQAPASPRLAGGFRHVHDLTHTFSPRLPVYPAFRPVAIRERFTLAADGFYANEVTFDEHTGTHMDAPLHFVPGTASADLLPPDRLVAPLAVISIAARAATDPDATLTVDDILAWEQHYGRLPEGAFVALHSGWEDRLGSPDRFLNRDAAGTMHAPGFGEEAARFLVEARDIVGAGVDTLSLDPAAAEQFTAHQALLGAGKYGIELMANLNEVPPSGATVVVGGPTHERASGGPVRVLALHG